MLVLTVGAGVYGFTYDSIVGEFILSHPDMKARAHACSAWPPGSHCLPQGPALCPSTSTPLAKRSK